MIFSQSTYGRFGGFGYLGRPGDAWDQWCNTAADVWAANGGTAAEAETLRAQCVECNQKGFFCHGGQAPQTALGKLARGLPVHFSSDPSITQQGILGGLKSVVTTGSKDAAGVIVPSTPAVNPSQIHVDAFNNAVVRRDVVAAKAAIERARSVSPDVARILEQELVASGLLNAQNQGGGSSSWFPSASSMSTGTKVALGISAVALIGGAFMLAGSTKTRSAPMAGYSKRKRRKARRSRR